MSVLVVQDERHPEGGYAVLRFPEITAASGALHLMFQPLDEPLRDFAQWPRGRIAAVETAVKGGVLEVVVGPDVVNVMPADVAVQITIEELDHRSECRWPALPMQQRPRRRKLPGLERPAIAEPVTPRARRVQPQAAVETEPAPEPDRPVLTAPAQAPIEVHAEPISQVRSEPPAAEPRPTDEVALAGSDPGAADERLDAEELRLPGSDHPNETVAAEPAKDIAPPPQLFGRDAIAAKPQRGGLGMVLPIVAALLAGVAIGAVGYGYVYPRQPIPGPSSPPAADSSAADRLLMQALDSPDTTDDGDPIFRTSKDELWSRADGAFRRSDFAASAKSYRMAARVAMHEANVSELVDGLASALDGSPATKPEAAGLRRLFFSLSVVAGDVNALCRLAADYDASDPQYAGRLRERARSLGVGGQQGC